ncbi:MAG: phage head spike fiber domain-containing protein [Bellilinea sp.]
MALTREKFYVITPKAATNLITNPSLENAITGWVASGAGVSIARVSTQQRRGAYSCEVTTATGITSSAFFIVSLTSGLQYTFSADVKDISGLAFRVRAYDLGGAQTIAQTQWTGNGSWVRKAVTFTPTTTGTHYLYIDRNSVADTQKFYFDGAQLELGSESTYFDGDSLGQTLQKDFGWNGTPHASTSYRLSSTRAGGTLVDIETYASILSHIGLGRAPEQLFTSEISADGELYQATKVMPRDFVINMVFSGTTSEVISKRKSLLSALALDKTPVRQPIVLRYVGVDDSGNWMTDPVDIPCHYRGGLERSAVTYGAEISAVQFRAVNPYHNIDGGTGQPLGYATTVTNFANIGFRDRDGVWRAMGTGCNGEVRSIVEAPDGSIYVGGAFTLAGGVANTAYIAKWNGTAWSALGTGMNGSVFMLALDAAGNLYAGGSFTLAGGVANTAYIAKWNGTAWSALSTGMNNNVFAVAMGKDGILYAGGAFTLASGVANTAYIAKWNGTAWSALGTGMSSYVRALAVDAAGNLYAGGSFSLAGGVANTNKIAKWNGTAWSALGTGMSDVVYGLAVGADGQLYAGGLFTLASGVANTAHIAKWNGTAWSALGTGMNDSVYSLSVGQNNTLFTGGFFTTAGGLTMPDRMAVWSGGAWKAVEINVNDSAAYVYTILPLDDNRLYFGGSWTGSSATSATSAAQNNTGTKVYPAIVMTGPGTIWSVKNYLNGDAIYFKSLTLLTGETITLITDPRRFSITSSFRGNVQSYISPGSSGFALEPGSNNISAFLTGGDANSSVVMTWQPAVTSIEEALR